MVDLCNTVAMAWRRMLFAGATVQALAEAAGPDASAAAAAWLAACLPLWSAIAQTVHLAAQQPPSKELGAAVSPAVEAADSWAAETGGPCAAFDITNFGPGPAADIPDCMSPAIVATWSGHMVHV